MDTPAGCDRHTSGTRQRAAILGSVTVSGSPEQVAGARSFIARTLAGVPGVDCDAATLLTSELVTNAIQHTDSEGHGLFLVQALAAQWGYLRDPAGTTVWFHLTTVDVPAETDEPGLASDYLAPTAASTAARTPAQMAATSSSPAT